MGYNIISVCCPCAVIEYGCHLYSFDTAVYTVTETARFRTASAAGAMVAQKLNRIGTPSQTFGNSNGNWKCEDAEVSWNGKYWLAKLAWTRSGSDDGWDEDLYGSAEQ